VKVRDSPKRMNANKMTNGLYTVSTMAEIPAPKILREWRKIISAIPIPIMPLMDKMSKSVFENCELGMRGTPIIKQVRMKSESPIILFTGLITIGETRSPIFLKMIMANAQNMAERSEHISPMYGIAVINISIMR
jgi:hypothetical protein